MGVKEIFDDIIALDRKIAELRDQLGTLPEEQRADGLEPLFVELAKGVGENDPIPLELGRAADLVAGLAGERAGIILTAGLNHVSPDVRMICGELLVLVADDGLDRLLPAVEQTLTEGGLAAEEMPFVLAEVEDPEASRVLERFLAHADGEVVASAIEALAELGDPDSRPAIEALVKDQRQLTAEQGETRAEWTVGQLARDALELIDTEE